MEWFNITLSDIGGIVASSVFIYIALLIIVRINGLRSFSKMSGHDFAVTVAIGSIIASTVTAKSPAVTQGAIAIIALLGLQTMFSWWRLRRNSPKLENTPIIIMRDGIILHDNLKKVNITESDLYAKLREANVLQLSEVRAAVFEATGDVSILHGDAVVDDVLLKNLRQ